MTAGVIPPATPIEAADDALMAAGHGITDLLKIPTARDEATDAALTAGRRSALAEDRDLAPGRGRVHLQARGDHLRRPARSTEPWGHLPGVALAGRPCFLMPGPYAPIEQVDEGLNFLRNLASALPTDRA